MHVVPGCEHWSPRNGRIVPWQGQARPFCWSHGLCEALCPFPSLYLNRWHFSFPLQEPHVVFVIFFQEMRGLQSQSGGDVSVEVNATPGINLMEKLNAMRCEYERLIENNRKEVESWYETKVKHRRALVIKSFTKYWTYLQQVKGNLSHVI